MVTWTDVRAWDHWPLEDAAGALRSLGDRLEDAAQDTQTAHDQVLSEGAGVQAARGALRGCASSCAYLAQEVAALARAVDQACQGVAEVVRRVRVCQDYAACHPLVVLSPDGTVTTQPDQDPGTGGGQGGTASTDQGKAQAQADELTHLVRTTITYANQVDTDLASALNAMTALGTRSDDDLSILDLWMLPFGVFSTFSRVFTDIFPVVDKSLVRRLSTRGYSRSGWLSDVGLGKPVRGEHADMPGVNPWQYKGDSEKEGSGKHGQRSPSDEDCALYLLVETAARTASSKWPDASANLLHYLGNSGTPVTVDVDRMLEDVSTLNDKTQADIKDMTKQALKDAKASGTTEVVTYPFTTEWYGCDSGGSKNWFYALGDYQYCLEGTVTVYPPDPENGRWDWAHKYEYRVHVADRYNWDDGKSVTILGQEVPDTALQRLHQVGIAQEYDVTGESSVKGGGGSGRP